MHIAIDARLRAYRGGGIAEHVGRLVEALAAAPGHEADRLWALEHRRQRGPDLGALPGVRASRLLTPPHHRWESWALPLEIRARGAPDLLHSPDFVLPAGWRGPGVVTVHDLAFLRRPELLTEESRRYYGQVSDALSRARRVIAVSEHTRREILALTAADPARVRVVPNVIPERFLEEGDPGADAERLAPLDLPEGYLLFVSTIEPRKNVPVLLEALAALVQEGRDATLVLAGADGWKSEAVYSRACALGLLAGPAPRARFLGRVEAPVLRALYRRAAALAHPALDEGFGLTPLEAMAAGCPVLASDAGALPEVLGDAATFLPPTDAAAWTAGLRAALDAGPDQRRARAAAGRARARLFSPARAAEATWRVYAEALDEARGERAA